MREIIYRSVASERLGGDDIFRIVYRAKRANGRAGLSGFLIYSSGHFLQLLEGPHLELRRTYRVIAQDMRHSDVTVLSERFITERAFPDWRMRRIERPDEAGARRFMAERFGDRIPVPIDAALTEFYATIEGSRMARID